MFSSRLSGLCLVGAVILSGCASYKFSSNDYEHFAFQWSAANYCSKVGLMDAETAATGMRLMTRKLSNSTYDPALLNQAVGKFNGRTFAPEGCRNAAVTINGWKNILTAQKEDDAETARLSDAFKNTAPKQTYCNRIGTQLLCNTY